jgi:hypothetical protein
MAGRSIFSVDQTAQDRVAVYLLGIIERSREHWSVETQVLLFERISAPLSAPFFLVHLEHWTHGASVPAQSFCRRRSGWRIACAG